MSSVIRRFASRRSVSSCDSPGPRVPTPPPTLAVPPPPACRSRCFHMPRMRGRLYSSCASSTWSFPSAETACWAKMSRISCVRSTTRAESASSSARCWTGSSSSSTSSTSAWSRAYASFSSSSFPLPTYRRGSACERRWTISATGATSGGACQLAELRQLAVRVGALGEHGEEQPTFGLRAVPELGSASRHQPKYAAVPGQDRSSTLAGVSDLAERLARRTSELVDIPSESLHEEAIRERLRSLVPASFAPVYEGDEAFLWARPRRRGVPLLVLAGHYDTVPAQENVPGPDRERRGARLRRERHEGRCRRCARARAGARATRPRCGRRRAAPVRAGGAATGAQPAASALRRMPARPRRRAGDPPRADRSHDPGGLRREPGRARDVPRRQRPLGASVARRQRPPPRDRGPRARRHPRAPRGDRRRAALLRSGVGDAARRRHRRQRGARPRGRDAEPPLPARPLAGRGGAARSLALVPTDATVEVVGNSPPAQVVVDAPLVQRLREGSSLSVEPKQAWTNVADFTRAGSPPSTSVPARRGTRTRATSWSRSPRSSGPTSRCGGSRSMIG